MISSLLPTSSARKCMRTAINLLQCGLLAGYGGDLFIINIEIDLHARAHVRFDFQQHRQIIAGAPESFFGLRTEYADLQRLIAGFTSRATGAGCALTVLMMLLSCSSMGLASGVGGWSLKMTLPFSSTDL